MVTIQDVARKANVSITTVSRVINDKPDVSKETKERINKIIKEMGYKPNSVARGLVLRKTNTLGLLIPDISNPFFPEVARGIEDFAKNNGFSVIFCNTDNKKSEEKKAINLLRSKQVDGIILSLSFKNKEELEKLRKENFPVVQIDREIPDINYPIVKIDNIKSGYKATRYLIESGHTKIAHITGNTDTKTGQDRLEGYKKALEEFDIEINEKWILKGDYSKDSGYREIKRLLKQDEPPTAIFIANDLMAIGTYEALMEKNIKIPDELSIIGHDDIDIASIVNPKLTTLSQPKYKLGQLAAKILISRIEKQKFPENCKSILESELIIRNSVKRLK